MTTLADVREQIADALTATIPTADLGDIAVSAAPVDAMTAPGYMVEWADPMLVSKTFCTYDARVVVRVIGPRIDADNATAIVENLLAPALVALADIGMVPDDVAAPAPFDIGGVQFLAARITTQRAVTVEIPAVNGSAVFVAVATMTATGTAIAAGVVDGAAVLHAVPGMVGAGTVVAITVHLGAATLSATAALAAAGTVVAAPGTITGAATFHAVPALAAAGTVVAGAGFSPPDIATLLGWWDASDAGTVTASGSPLKVSAWADKSTAARHVVQGTSTAQPVYGTASQNGKAGIRFAGGSPGTRLFASFTGSPVAGTTGTWFVVFKPDSFAAFSRVMSLPNVTGLDYDNVQSFIPWIRSSTQPTFGNFYNSSFRAGSAVSQSVAHVGMSRRNGDTVSASVDGGTRVDVTGVGTSAFAIVHAGFGDTLASNQGPFLGDIFEAIWYQAALSDADVVTVETYLANKWFGLPVLAGLAGWWAADDATTITASGGNVSAWADKSGLGRTFTASGGGQPTTGRTMNGRAVLDFDGVDDRMVTATLSLPQPSTVFIVAANDDGADGLSATLFDGLSATAVARMSKTSGNAWSMNAGTQVLGPNGAVDTAAHIHAAVFNTTTSERYVDGALVASGNAGGAYPSTGLVLAATGVPNGWWDGPVAEVIAYTGVLTAAQRLLVENYLRAKWATP